MAQLVKSLPTMQEILVQSLGQEGPLEKEMATHSLMLPGNPKDRGACGLQSRGLQGSDIDLVTKPPPLSYLG